MRLTLVPVAFGLALFCGVPVHAVQPMCATRLYASVDTLFPWPDPTPEMIEALRTLAEAQTTDAFLRQTLREGLNRPSAHLIVRFLFEPATVTEVRTTYGGHHGPPAASLKRDPGGVRETLARASARITDRWLQRAWMNFFARDPVRAVRHAAVESFLHWPDQAERDAFVLNPTLDETEMTFRALVAKADLLRLSPFARWEAIKRILQIKLNEPKFIEPTPRGRDPVIEAALDSFGTSPVPHMWYRDQLRHRVILDVFSHYDEAPLNDQMRRGRAQELGQVLHSIGQPHYRELVTREIERLARIHTPMGDLANDVLIWRSIWQTIYNFTVAQSQGLDHQDNAVANIHRDVHDVEGRRLAMRLLGEYKARPFKLRDHYSKEDLAHFEALLRAN